MIGSNTVQQNDISWSNLIRGKDARAQTKTKNIILVFTPNIKPYNIPSNIGSFKVSKISNTVHNTEMYKYKSKVCIESITSNKTKNIMSELNR